MKRCPVCGFDKPSREFHLDESRVSGFSSYCSDCYRSYHRRYMAQYRTSEKQRDYMREYYSRPKTRAARMWRAAKSRAKKRNEPFTLTLDWIEYAIIAGKCCKTGYYFILVPDDEHQYNPFAPSLDRIDSTKPYSNENVQIVIDWYNRAKGQHCDAAFIEFCHNIVKRHGINQRIIET